jgi:hypothetical protein
MLVSSLYWSFQKGVNFLKKTKIFNKSKNFKETITFCFTEHSTIVFGTDEILKTLTFFDFDKKLWNTIVQSNQKKYVEIRMSFQPDLFIKLTSMFLTINDKWVLENDDRQKFAFLQEELIDTWLYGNVIEEELRESWRTK